MRLNNNLITFLFWTSLFSASGPFYLGHLIFTTTASALILQLLSVYLWLTHVSTSGCIDRLSGAILGETHVEEHAHKREMLQLTIG